jgi:hypothetical protein
MACFQTKDSNLGKFWRALQWQMLVYFMAIRSILRSYGTFCGFWYILWPFGIFCGLLVYFVAFWYILWPFSIFSPVLVCCTLKNMATLFPDTYVDFAT